MWVDFLLKETEEREKKLSGITGGSESTDDSRDNSTNINSASSPLSNQRFSTGAASISSPTNNQIGSEFSTVPLTYSDSKTSSSKLFPRH